jgi:hypothetical protein
LITTFTSGADAAVDALALSPAADTLYVGGEFTTLGGTVRSRTGALNSITGALSTWNPGADGVVETLAVSSNGSTIYAGGTFATAGGAARANVVALNAVGGAATSWNPSVTGCFWATPSDPPCVTAVHALSLSGDGVTVYVGGLFGSAGGANRSNLAALNASTGAATGWNPNANAAVRSVAAGANGVFTGGEVTSVNGVTRNRVAALDAASGAVINSFVVDADDWVQALAVSSDGSRLYLGGAFMNVNGANRIHVAAVDATTGALDSAWNPAARGGEVQALAVSGNRVFIGGRFTSLANVAILKVGSVDATTGAVDVNWHPNPDDWVAALAVAPGGSTVYVGGMFNSIGGRAQRKMAAVNATTGAVTSWAPTLGYPVLAILPAPNGQVVYAGGAGGRLTGNRASAYSVTANGSPLWETFGGDGNIQALALSADSKVLYIGGHFATMNGADRQHFSAVDAANNTLLPFAPVINSSLGVWALAMNGGSLYAGGDFTRVSGLPQQGFARFLGTGPAMTVTSGPAAGAVTSTTMPSYGGTAVASLATVTRVEARIDSGPSTTNGVVCTGCGTASASWTWAPLSPLGDGTHTITFSGADSYGDVSTLSRTLVVDTGAPSIAITGGPADAGSTNSAQPTWNGTATDGAGVAGVQAGIDGGALSSSGVTCTACNTASVTWKFTPPSPLPDGPHTVTVRATDVTGNLSPPVSRSVTIDTARPTYDTLTAVNGSATVTVTVSFSEPLACSSVGKADFSATVNGASRTVTAAACTTPSDASIDLTLKTAVRTGDTLVVTLKGTVSDVVGNSAIIPVSRSLLVGGTNVAPTLTVGSGPADSTATSAARPAWSGSAGDLDGAVARVEVSVDAGAFATAGVNCTGCGTVSATWMFTAPLGLGDGSHAFAFRSVDNAGLVSVSAGRTVTVDTTAPSVAVGSGPADAGLAATGTPTYGGTATDGGSGVARIEAKVDSSLYSTTGVVCTGCGTASATWTFTPATALAEGIHTVTFRAVDNVSTNSLTAPRTVTVDFTAPTLSGLAATGGNPLVTLTFSEPVDCASVAATDFAATAGGSAVAVGVATCSGASAASVGLTLDAAPSGGATVVASLAGPVSDVAGNVASNGSRSTVATNAPPAAELTSGPAESETVTTAFPAYGGSASDADGTVARVEIALDGAAWSTGGILCSDCGTGNATWSYFPATALADGSRTLSFRSVDGAGAASPALTRRVTVDTGAPGLAITTGPVEGAVVTTASPVYAGTASDAAAVASVEASVDGAAYATAGVTCSACGTTAAAWSFSPAVPLADGLRTVAFRSVDNAGNVSVVAARTVVVDTTAPTLEGVAATGGVAAMSATFSEPIKCSTVSRGKFSATVNGVTRTINSAACAGTSDPTIDLNMAGSIRGGDAVGLTLVGNVKDDAGLIAPLTSRSGNASNASPLAAITTGPADTGFTTAPRPTWGGSASDPDGLLGSVEVSLDGGAFSTAGVVCTGCGNANAIWSFTPPTALPDGPHTIEVRSVDNAAAFSIPVPRSVSVDTERPVLVRVDTTAGSTSVTLTFNQPVVCASVAAGDFAVTVNSALTSVTGVSCSGDAAESVDVTFSRTIRGGDTAGVSMTAAAGGVTDPAGNVTTTGSKSVTVGDTPPVLLLVSGPPDQSFTPSGQPTFGGTADDSDGIVSAIEVSADGGEFSAAGVSCTSCGTASASWSFTPADTLADGPHTLTFRALDNAGVASVENSRTVTVDSAAPVPSFTSGPADGAIAAVSSPAYGGNAADLTSTVTLVEVDVDGAGYTTAGVVCTDCGSALAGWTWTPATPLGDGSHVITVRASDAAGNASTSQRTVTVDTAGPDLAITTGPADGDTVTIGTPTFEGTASDATTTVSSVRVDVDGAGYSSDGLVCTDCGTASATWTWTPATPLGDGPHAITFDATDAAGHIATTAGRAVTVDTTGPGLGITSGPAGGAVIPSGQPTYEGTADDAATVEVDVDGGGFTTDGLVCTGCGTASATWTWTPTAPLAEGAHGITFRATDPAGNQSTVNRTVTVDTGAPAVAVTAGPADGSTITTASPTYEGTATDVTSSVSSVRVDVDGTGYTTDGLVCTGCGTALATWTWTPTSALSDGPHVVTFEATDAAGNLSDTATRTVTVDTTGPDVAVTSGPADGDTVTSGSPIYGGSATDATTTVTSVAVDVDGAGFTTDGLVCTGCGTASATWTWTPQAALSDGLRAVTFRATDVAGHLSVAVSRAVTVDTAAPAVAVMSGPADGSTVPAGSPTFEGTATDLTTSVSSVQVDVDGAGYMTDGLVCTDCGTASATWTWSPVTPLGDGAHVVTFQATDASGHTATTAIRSVTVDTGAPALEISDGPVDGDTIPTGSPAFGGTATDATSSLSAVTVDVDGAGYTTDGLVCTGCGTASATWTWTPPTALDEGSHVITFQSADGAGHTAATASRTVTVDTVSPDLGITAGPADGNTTTSGVPTYEGSAIDATTTVTSVRVDVDSNGFTTDGLVCTDCDTTAATWTWTPTTPLTEGLHVVTFQATDAASNLSATAIRTVRVDTAPPAVEIGSGPSDGSTITTGSPVFDGTATDVTSAVTAVEVDVDGAGYSADDLVCTDCGTASASWTWTPTTPLSDGSHVVTFRSTDAAGHLSAIVGRTVTVDTAGPDLGITSGPVDGATVISASPTYEGDATDATTMVSTVRVDVDGAGYTTDGLVCTGCGTASATWTWTPTPALSDGLHVISFEATDVAGNPSASATRSVTVDTTGPAVGITSGPGDGDTITSGTPIYDGTATDATTAVTAVEIDVDGGGYGLDGLACTDCGTASATWTWTPTTSLSDGSHTITVRATDAAGNASTTVRTLTVQTA